MNTLQYSARTVRTPDLRIPTLRKRRDPLGTLAMWVLILGGLLWVGAGLTIIVHFMRGG